MNRYNPTEGHLRMFYEKGRKAGESEWDHDYQAWRGSAPEVCRAAFHFGFYSLPSRRHQVDEEQREYFREKFGPALRAAGIPV